MEWNSWRKEASKSLDIQGIERECQHFMGSAGYKTLNNLKDVKDYTKSSIGQPDCDYLNCSDRFRLDEE